MLRFWLLMMVFVLVSMVGAGGALAASSKKGPPRKAILLVAFGTSAHEARKAYDHIDTLAGKAFPDVEIRWAYTSRTIRMKLAAQGETLHSPEVALAQMMDEGFTHVAVLSLHVIPGEEFHALSRNVQLFSEMAGGFERILLAQPLLVSYGDMVRVAKILLKEIPSDRKPEDAVLFMGHGSGKHAADAMYAAMSYILQDLASNVFVATVEGNPTLNDVLPKLLERKVKKVYLIPFMAVAGEHARSDMAGAKPESWQSVLTRNGIACKPILTGSAESPDIVEVWLDHLREVFSQL